MLDTLHEPEVTLPIVGEYDVAVIGGGLAGFAAAARARANGLSAVIIEERGSLGHEAWASLQVFPRPCPEDSLPAIAIEIRDRLRAVDAWTDACFDAPALQLLLDQLVTEHGIGLFLQAFGEKAIADENGGFFVTMGNKSGRQAIHCRYVVDATANARMLASAKVALQENNVGHRLIRRAMLFAGTHEAPSNYIDTYLLPPECCTVECLAHGRHTMWPGETIVWADFDDIEGQPDLIDRETYRRMMQIVEYLHATLGQFKDASLMLIAHDPLWPCGRTLAQPVLETETIPLALDFGNATEIPVPAAWLEPQANGGLLGCGPWLNAPGISVVDYADFGNAMRIGDACAQKLA